MTYISVSYKYTITFPEYARSQVNKGGYSSGEMELI